MNTQMNISIPKQLTYESAEKELQDIYTLIDSGSIGMDELVTKVKRARELLNFCKKKLQSVDNAIKDIFTDDEEVTDEDVITAPVQPIVRTAVTKDKLPLAMTQFETEELDDLPF